MRASCPLQWAEYGNNCERTATLYVVFNTAGRRRAAHRSVRTGPCAPPAAGRLPVALHGRRGYEAQRASSAYCGLAGAFFRNGRVNVFTSNGRVRPKMRSGRIAR